MGTTSPNLGMRALGWHIRSHREWIVVTLRGELDAGTAPSLDDRVRPLAETGRHLVVDLKSLTFCGCAGLALFVRWQARADAAGGSLHLAAAPRSVRRVIAITGLQDQLPIAADTAEVINAPGREAITAMVAR